MSVETHLDQFTLHSEQFAPLRYLTLLENLEDFQLRTSDAVPRPIFDIDFLPIAFAHVVEHRVLGRYERCAIAAFRQRWAELLEDAEYRSIHGLSYIEMFVSPEELNKRRRISVVEEGSAFRWANESALWARKCVLEHPGSALLEVGGMLG
jgi:hypothetical protein